MKNILLILASFIITISLYSCVRSSCSDLNCQQGASCVDDHCQCPPGYEGPECTIMAKTRFVGIWVGTNKCEGFPQQLDTVEIMTECNPDRIILYTGIGNFATNNFIATARTPEAIFEPFEDENVVVTPYIRVDANQMQMTIVSVNKRDKMRYVCEFEGRLVPGTNTDPGFTTPKGACN